MKKVTVFILFMLNVIGLSAQHYVAIGRVGKVFDEANSKYVTLNQNNEEVKVTNGMVFKTFEKTPGWIKIEYSPGLHGFIPDNIVNADLSAPEPGEYPIKNDSTKKINIKQAGESWTANIDNKEYKGTQTGNFVVFNDDNGNIAYSLVNFGNAGGPIVICYDNLLTKFF